ncbi:MAG TPA: AAA family ATPase [Microvirga sp.]|nr:AAA family ATPase [Microvirga sp.]
MISAVTPDRALADLAALLARVEGRRDALQARRAALTEAVEIAKGRLAARGAVEAFLEAAHGHAARRNLGAFETLLTALVREVLPGEKPVRLDLSTDRGLPALDICVARPDGALEDVLEDNGGALTNVVAMALRLIAVVKADVGRFLALDEADCWIAPERVPSFYRVLEDGAARLGVQCLAVSHHDLSRFAGQFHIARVVGEPEAGVEIAASDLDTGWRDEQPGLRFIRLIDVQAYRDATLRLSPGVNALIGPNDRGKSTFIRALRAVFYGEARDSLVRAGARTATVEIGVAGGRVLRFVRRPRRTPVNVWSLHEADGSVVADQAMRYETGGRAVPGWVESLFRITKVEDLDVHIAHQKFPVFLLGETPSRRSAVLSIGQEASYIRDMIGIHKERCTKDLALVRSGERELAELAAMLEELGEIDSLRETLDAARAQAVVLRAAAERLESLEAHGIRRAELSRDLAAAQARLEATAALPHPDRLATLRAEFERERRREEEADRLRAATVALAHARARLALLAALPAAVPEPESTRTAEDTLAGLARLRAEAAGTRQRLAAIDGDMAALRADLARLMDETDGRCPTCGSSADADLLLAGHLHAAQEAA